MSETRRKFEPKTVVSDRKRTDKDYGTNRRLYEIVGEAKPAGADEPYVLFSPLFGKNLGKTLAEPASAFYAEIPKGKRKKNGVNLKYRYEAYREIEIGNLFFGHSRGTWPVERGVLQDEFGKFLEELNCDEYGRYDGGIEGLEANERGGCRNETFEINPYYWGEDDEEAERPNFAYAPEKLELRWYKYPMRDSYCNEEMNLDRMRGIIEKCLASVGKRPKTNGKSKGRDDS